MFIVFKAINIFWREYFVTPWKFCFFLTNDQANLFLCKDRGLMPRLTAVWRIVWYGVVWFGTVEFDCLGWQRFGELCGMGSLIWNSRIRLPSSGLENCVVWAVWFGTVEFDCLEQLKVLWYCWNRVDIRLRTDGQSSEKLVSKPNYERTTIFSEDLVAVHMKKTELVFNKPVYLGMSIRDISKTLMYDFHYNYIKKKYGQKRNRS